MHVVHRSEELSMAPAAHIVQEGLQDFARALEQAHLDAPWLGPEMSHDPVPHMVPFVWRWANNIKKP